jgi:hypothetical protein
MAADEHLRRTFDTLAARLRDDISRQLDAVSADLRASLESEQERAVAAAAVEERTRALAQAAEERVRALAVAAEEHEEALDRARGEARDTGRVEALELARAEHEAADLAESLRLVEAIRAVDRAKSLSEILDTLASCSAREAARVGVLLVRGRHLRAWRFIGFGAALDESADYEIPMADAGVIDDAIRTGAAASGDSAAHAPAFASFAPGRETLALPVTMNGQIVAVLYADQGDRESERRRGWPSALEIMTRHAARSLEAITALRAAQVMTAAGVAQELPAGAPPPAPAASDPAEDVQSARRYARLLISEIKLYHEADVVAGRRDGNLADRLGGEIARARVLYEQRVPARVRQGGDYFHEELVRTLADGDAQLLVKN